MIFVQTEKEKLCCLTQARTHKPKYFTGFKERCFAPPLLSQGCFSPLLFGTNSAIVWLRQQAACQQVQHTQERAAGQTSWSAGTPEGKISHHSMLTHWSWDLILYSGHMGGRAASALLLLVSVSQAATALIKKKKAAAGHFEVLIIFLKLVSTVFQLECGIYSHCFIMRQAQTRRHPLFLKPFIWTAKQAVVAIKCPSWDKVPAWSSGKNRDSSKYCIG